MLRDEVRTDLPWEEIRKVHYALVRAYLEILTGISKLPVRNKLGEVEKYSQVAAARKADAHPNSYVRPFQLTNGFTIPKAMVRLFAERHVARRLRELAAYYTQLRETIPVDETNAGNVEWLDRAAKGSRAFADSLVAWKNVRSILQAFWSGLTGLGLTIVLTKVVLSGHKDGLLWLVSFPILWIGVYAVFFVTDAFALKREFFLPGAQFMERSKELPPITHNVYRVEADLFGLISRLRKPEFPWDHASRLTALLLFFGLMGTLTISRAPSFIMRVFFFVGTLLGIGQVASSIWPQLVTRLKHQLR
jgi:hypothetical protein